MSIPLNDTATRKGLVQIYEKEIGADYGDISGNADKLLELVADINLALDDYTDIAIKSAGTWGPDDFNQLGYPIFTADLVSGQRAYAMLTDQYGNMLLDVYKVFVASPAGLFRELLPVDVSTGSQELAASGVASGVLYSSNLQSFTNGQNASGIPTKYDKLANGIFLDPIPNYNYTGGLKLYGNREAAYFTVSQSTKVAGFPGIHHRYLALKPALDYARRNGLSSYERLKNEVDSYEGDEQLNLTGKIAAYFSHRTKDERPRMRVSRDSNK